MALFVSAFYTFQNDVAAGEREITQEEVRSWCEEFHVINFIETSAKTSQNVSTAFVMAVRQWKKFDHNANVRSRDTIDLTRPVQLSESRKSSSCCGGSSNGISNQSYDVIN